MIRGLAPGEVATSAEVALEAGRPVSAQAVANHARDLAERPSRSAADAARWALHDGGDGWGEQADRWT